MSASRDKRQRQGSLNQHLTQKEFKEQQEAAAAKRKTVLYWIIGIVVAVLVVLLLIGNANRKNQVAATIDGEDFTVAQMSYFYYSARNQERNLAYYNTAFGMEDYYTTYHTDVADNAQYYDEEAGQTFQDYFLETALDSLTEVYATCKAAEAEGYTLSADGQASIQEAYSSIDTTCAQNGITRRSYFIQMYGEYMTESVFHDMLTKTTLAIEFQTNHNTALTDESFGEDRLSAYYEENATDLDTFRYRVFFIDGTAASTDEDGNTIEPTEEETEAAMDDAVARGEAAVAQVNAATDKEAAFIEAVPNYVSESSKATYEDNDDASLATSLGSAVAASSFGYWILEDGRQAGDITSLETASGVYVVLYLDRYLIEEPTADFRQIFVTADLMDEDDETTEDIDESLVPTETALDAAKAQAESLLATWKAGDQTADSFSALVDPDDEDSNLTLNTYTYSVQGTYSDLNDWLFDEARQPGDTTLVENTNGCYLVYYEKSNVPVWQQTAITALRADDQQAWLDALKEPYTAQATDNISMIYA